MFVRRKIAFLAIYHFCFLITAVKGVDKENCEKESEFPTFGPMAHLITSNRSVIDDVQTWPSKKYKHRVNEKIERRWDRACAFP